MSKASVSAVEEAWKPSSREGILFPVGLFKLAIMSATTLGVYQGYWMYRNWKYLRQRRKVHAHAMRRSDYPFFFLYPLFREIRAVGMTFSSSQPKLSPGVLFLLWLGLTMLANLPDPYYLIANVDVIPLLIMQSYINRLNEENGCERFIDYKLTTKSWLGIAAGIIGNVVVLIISMKLG
ncbi:MAG: hypothetical protein ACRD3W_02110 [Terriglobales bacterium]